MYFYSQISHLTNVCMTCNRLSPIIIIIILEHNFLKKFVMVLRPNIFLYTFNIPLLHFVNCENTFELIKLIKIMYPEKQCIQFESLMNTVIMYWFLTCSIEIARSLNTIPWAIRLPFLVNPFDNHKFTLLYSFIQCENRLCHCLYQYMHINHKPVCWTAFRIHPSFSDSRSTACLPFIINILIKYLRIPTTSATRKQQPKRPPTDPPFPTHNQ